VSAANPNVAAMGDARWGYGLHQQLALRAIRYADVRYGILPSQSPSAQPNLRRRTTPSHHASKA